MKLPTIEEVTKQIARAREMGLGPVEATGAAVGPLLAEIRRLRDLNTALRYRPKLGDLTPAQRKALEAAVKADALRDGGRALEGLAELAKAHKKALDALERRGYLSKHKWPAPQVTPAGRLMLEQLRK